MDQDRLRLLYQIEENNHTILQSLFVIRLRRHQIILIAFDRVGLQYFETQVNIYQPDY